MLPFFALLAAVLHSVAAVLLVGDLVSSRDQTRALSRFVHDAAVFATVLAAALVLWAYGVGAALSGGMASGTLAALLGVGSLILRIRTPFRAAGAVLTPVAGLLMLVFAYALGAETTAVGELSWMVVVHIALALMGLGAFGMAAALAVLYLLQERQLKARNFGALFRHLPGLDELDTAGFRLVSFGFSVFTVAIVLGGLAGGALDHRLLLSVLAWFCFASVLYTRWTSGWRGRQAAWMTLAGYIVALLVLLSYPRAGG